MNADGNARLAGEIRAEIARQRLSARRVAASLGKPPSTVSRWVSGDTPMKLEEIEAFARVLNVSVVDLVARAYSTVPSSSGGTQPPTSQNKNADSAPLPRLDSNQKPAGSRRIPRQQPRGYTARFKVAA